MHDNNILLRSIILRFDFGQTGYRMDICDSRVAFITEQRIIIDLFIDMSASLCLKFNLDKLFTLG